MKLNEQKSKFLNYLVEYRGRSEKTKQAYDFDLTKFINFLHAQRIVDIEGVTTQRIEDYLFELRVSTVTKARIRSSIKSFFNYLFRKELIVKNPGVNLESIKKPEKRPEYLSQEQCEVFLKTIEKKATPYYRERDWALVNLLIKSGLRRAEIIGLNVSDVDLSRLQLRVRRKGSREAYVIIHQELAKDLKKYLRSINRDGDKPLFMSKRGQRLSPSSVWHLIKVYSQKAGLNGDVTVHSLRHTFATTLLAKALPLPYIQALMGHKSSQTTSRYLHFQNTELAEAFNRVSFAEGR